MKIIVDAFGGDNCPLEVIKGCALAVEGLDIDIVLTGIESEIRKCAEEKNGCPVEAITFDENGKVVINQELCVGCGICKNRCPHEVIAIKQTMPMRKDLHEYFEKEYNLDLKIWNTPEG